MARWDPGTEERLREAAMDLFEQRGYENVTVADIAERAGITRRTYFRYFPDRREVLFAHSEQLPIVVAETVLAADADTPPLAAALDALAEGGTHIAVHPERAVDRQRVIDSSPELRERERTKLAAVSTAVQQALEQRGATPATAGTAAQISTLVFANAFRQWLDEAGAKPFPDCAATAMSTVRDVLDCRS